MALVMFAVTFKIKVLPGFINVVLEVKTSLKGEERQWPPGSSSSPVSSSLLSAPSFHGFHGSY